MALAETSLDPGADYGEVFTRRWVVELILDLVGYTADQDLATKRLIEPSCGTGAFLVAVVDRLIESCERHERPLASVGEAVRAFDLLEANAQRSRKAVTQRLHEAGVALDDAELIAASWITTGDFLLYDHEPASAQFVVGNPPYIRLESVPRSIMEEYRRVCPTMRGRADIYVGFYERGLQLLAPSGSLGFICADRWMRNQYGADLRDHVASKYAVEAVIAMHDVDAFEDDVSAYPAVVVLRNAAQGEAIVAEATASFAERDARRFSLWSRDRTSELRTDAVQASRVPGWFGGRDLWPTGTPAQLAVIADIESRFPPLEDTSTATRVGIGVATGCDSVYITDDAEAVESQRLLPLLQSGDITGGTPDWSGQFLINPWCEDGLVDLAAHPRLGAYLRAHEERLRARHIARTRPAQWFRTIDRVDSSLQGRPKLLLPDLKAASHPVLDDGMFYPHHNLYFVVSDRWDLRVLGGLLLSEIANLFVGAYCVKMRGGCYRFQAQYVRRIRVPDPGGICHRDASALAAAFVSRDVAAATDAACRVYGISHLPGAD